MIASTPEPEVTIATRDQVTSWFPGRDVTTEWAAAEEYITRRTRWTRYRVLSDGTTQELPAPPALVEAVRILTHRYLERRNSPVGIVGMDEVGAVRLPSVDRDVEALIAPWRQVVFG